MKMATVSRQVVFFLAAFFLHSGADAQSSGDLRLVGRNGVTSSSLTAGRLEVYYNGQWGTVCDNSFGSSEATVACRQLGFPAGYVSHGTISTSFRFNIASSSTPIWLDNLSCSTISDTRLIDCGGSTIGSNNCVHSQDVYVSCVGDGALRIGSTDILSFGRLEVYFQGQWGTVCDSFFFQTEANVACRQLGYSSASNYGNVVTLGYSAGSGPIWLDNVDCSSSDTMLSMCSHNGIGSSNNCDHFDDVAVVCSASITDLINTISTGVIIAIVVACIVPLVCIGVCILIICIAVCTGACCAAGASNRRNRTVATASTVATPPAAAVVTTTNTAQAQPGYTPYTGYQPASTAYPTKPGQPYPTQGAAPPYPSNPAPGYYPPQGPPQEKPPVELNQYPHDAAYPPPTTS